MPYLLIPQRGGTFGKKTVIRNLDAIRKGREVAVDIERLDFELTQWTGDDIIGGSHLIVVITDRLALALNQSGLRGYHLDPVEISTSSAFRCKTNKRPELAELPAFHWLRIKGATTYNAAGEHLQPLENDICIGTNVDKVELKIPLPKVMPLPTHAVICSDACVDVLKKFSTERCEMISLTFRGQ